MLFYSIIIKHEAWGKVDCWVLEKLAPYDFSAPKNFYNSINMKFSHILYSDINISSGQLIGFLLEFHGHISIFYVGCGSGHWGAAVLLPGFAVNKSKISTSHKKTTEDVISYIYA